MPDVVPTFQFTLPDGTVRAIFDSLATSFDPTESRVEIDGNTIRIYSGSTLIATFGGVPPFSAVTGQGSGDAVNTADITGGPWFSTSVVVPAGRTLMAQGHGGFRTGIAIDTNETFAYLWFFNGATSLTAGSTDQRTVTSGEPEHFSLHPVHVWRNDTGDDVTVTIFYMAGSGGACGFTANTGAIFMQVF